MSGTPYSSPPVHHVVRQAAMGQGMAGCVPASALKGSREPGTVRMAHVEQEHVAHSSKSHGGFGLEWQHLGRKARAPWGLGQFCTRAVSSGFGDIPALQRVQVNMKLWL